MGEFTLSNEVTNTGQKGIDTLTGELADIREKLVPKVPEMLISFNSCADSIKGILGHLLVLWGEGPIVMRDCQSLSIFTLEHHLQLAPASMAVISLISIDVKGFQVARRPGVEDFPVLWLIGRIEIEHRGFPAVNRARGHG